MAATEDVNGLLIDPNNIDFRRHLPPVGGISFVAHTRPKLEIHGFHYSDASDAIVLILDAAGRFIGASSEPRGEFCMSIPDNYWQSATWPIQAYVYHPVSNSAVPMELRLSAESASGNRQDIPSFRDRYIEVIIDAMKAHYTSVSSHATIKTGNNYQTVEFEKLLSIGGRSKRDLWFRHVNFKGKRVLDLGANTGELSRLARRRGADLVDGYEYDPFFVETGRMISAATGMTRVSLFQGDVTNRALYTGLHYDVALAFSVWVYINKIIDRLADVTPAVLLETHTLDHGPEMYIESMIKHFPYMRHLGYSDQKQDLTKSRAILMFAQSEEQLEGALRLTKLKARPYFDNLFFSKHPPILPDQFRDFATKLYAGIQPQNLEIDGGIGLRYFQAYICGYLEYLRDGCVLRDNIFLAKYQSAISEGRLDSNLRYLLSDDNRLVTRVTKKYEDFDHALAGRWHLVPPIEITPSSMGKFSFWTVDGREILADNIDGHHRHFLAQLLSAPTVDCMIREPEHLGKGVIEQGYAIR